MTNFSSEQNLDQIKLIQNTLLNIQRLTVKAFNAQNIQNLTFIILNDTYQVIKYDRSILFNISSKNKVSIIGISGQSNFNLQTELASRIKLAVKNLDNLTMQRVLTSEDFPASPESWDYIQSLMPSTVYWVPIIAGKEILGLWLEKHDDPEAKKTFESYGPLLKEMLVPAYAAAWEKISHRFKSMLSHLTLKKMTLFSLFLILPLFFIPIRLRIVAPCEVVAKDSFVVTAPVDGIVQQVNVEPGQKVKKNQVLFEYEKKIPIYRYEAVLKEVEVLQAEYNQTYALGIENNEEASKLAFLDFKLKKSQLDLAFAKKQLTFLTERSPIEGLVSVDNRNDWRGKPVKTGERIMVINNEQQAKIKIWIPERDNLTFAFDIPIQIFLNSIPSKTFQARFLFITPEVKLSGEELPSFEAEAEWLDGDQKLKLGLKGSAVIYGEKVSFFYYLFRKPIGAARKFIGI
jgi:multidrug resistance efflux pump